MYFFSRAGWNDGHTATWAFTEIDRTFALGAYIDHPILKKIENTFGFAVLVNDISPQHCDYLNTSGVDFIIGDGKLPHCAPEKILETFYNVSISKHVGLMLDYQYVQNPAYNADRGSVPYIISSRVHILF